jgi:hypothetical protein
VHYFLAAFAFLISCVFARKFTTMRNIVLAAAVTFISGVPDLAAAQAPVAVVEAVRGAVNDVEFMDYVSSGFTIELGSQGSVVLGYMKSCIQETITGGTVEVGLRESRVRNGHVERTAVACDAGRINLTDKEANQGAATSFRSIAQDVEVSDRTIDEPSIVIYGLSPMLETKATGKLVIRRLDAQGSRREINMIPKLRSQSRFYDLAKANVSLTTGSYVATIGTSKAYFRIDPTARPGSTPIIGRLVRLD